MMNIVEATSLYEQWVKNQIPTVQADFDAKHNGMSEDKHFFLRATDYRFAQLFAELCKELCQTPIVLSSGDLHVDQFSTWRDAEEARLILGVADFDEADLLPCAYDLVRLATSIGVAIEKEHLRISKSEAHAAILQGYADSIACGGKPIILEEENPELREMAIDRLVIPNKYWRKLDSQLEPIGDLPVDIEAEIKAAIESLLPKGLAYRLFKRKAGAGSRGRLRVAATANDGGRLAREAKFMVPSAWNWANGDQNGPSMLQKALDTLAEAGVRAADPKLKTHGRCVVRRLSASCSHLRLSDLPKHRDESKLAWAMGFEAANNQQGTAGATAALSQFLKVSGHNWLSEGAGIMSDELERDFNHWRKHHRSK